jgi:hypothetical protein
MLNNTTKEREMTGFTIRDSWVVHHPTKSGNIDVVSMGAAFSVIASKDDEIEELARQLAEARREAAEAQAIAAKFSPLFQCIGFHGSDVEIQRELQAVRTSSHDNPGTALQSAIAQAVAPYREHVRVLVEAVKLALSSHGIVLMSDPPRDAWKFRDVDAQLRAAIATVNQEGEQA